MASARIPEHALRQIWKHQHFDTTALRTRDGRSVTIISPGSPNPDSGPDFLEARLRIGGVLYTGDIELHCDAGSWQQHRHEASPLYNRVVLHVVLTDERPAPPARTASRRVLPLLILHPLLTPFPANLYLVESSGTAHHPSCCPASGQNSVRSLRRHLGKLADERLELKVRRFHHRLLQLADERLGILRERGSRYDGNADEIPLPAAPPHSLRDVRLWEQLLFEAIMESLGYEKNREPFLALARAVPLEDLRRHGLKNSRTMMAILFGQGGLLPSVRTIHDREGRRYLLDLKRRWKTLFPRQSHPLIHSSRWLFFRLRPQNFPTARLAAFSFLLPTLFCEDSFRNMIGAFRNNWVSSARILDRIHLLFHCAPDEFWKRHVHFGAASGRGRTALGRGRISDIVVNVLLPIVILYGRVFDDSAVLSAAERLYREHPPLQGNHVTRLLERELFAGEGALRTARLQQGSVQLYSTYCLMGRCAECVVRPAEEETARGNRPSRRHS